MFPKTLASSKIYPRVEILLWSQEIKQWNRLPLHQFLFFFLWPSYCDADAEHFGVTSQLQFKRMQANMTHTYCKTLSTESLPLSASSRPSFSNAVTPLCSDMSSHVSEGKWARRVIYTTSSLPFFKGKNTDNTSHPMTRSTLK